MYERILITGADGDIGKVLRENLRGVYPVIRLSHRRPFGDPLPGEEIMLANLESYPEVDAAMKDVDAVIHLGGRAYEAPWETIMQSNVVGTWNVFEAARNNGVKRVIFASSNHIIGYHRRGHRLTVTDPIRPDSRYGISKAFGESVGRMYADKYGLSVICQRIGSFQERPFNTRMLSTWLSPRDYVHLTRVCLDAPKDLHFEIVWGVSANDRGWWDNTPAERLGYRPQDNSETYAAEIEEAERKARESGATMPDDIDPNDQEAMEAYGKAVKAEEPPTEAPFQGASFCGMEFAGDLDKID